jgi:hypothetical protein
MNSKRHLLRAAGLALIVLTNAVALGGVAWNRGGEPDSRLALSDRELAMPWSGFRPDSENSGLSLQLRWRCLPSQASARNRALYYGSEAPAWLDAGKMRELGFDLRAPELTRPLDRAPMRHRQLAREVWLVLELDGPAYRQSLADAAKEAEAAKAADAAASRPETKPPVRAQAEDPDAESRLFAVDAGLDRDALRARHADRAMYAIVRARVSPSPASEGAIEGGRIDALSIDEVNVPLALRPVFDGLQPPIYHRRANVRFDATVAFGRRAEPWLAEAHTRPDVR